MTTPAIASVQRAFGDLLEAERAQRRAAEDLARHLGKVLLELAVRLDGERLEALRREDPSIPQYWGPEDWRDFFAGVDLNSDSWLIAQPNMSNAWLQRLEEENRALRRKVAELEAQMAAKQVEEADVAPDVTVVPRPSQGIIPPVGALIAQAKEVWEQASKAVQCPAFRKALAGRYGEAYIKAAQRAFLALYLIGGARLNAKLEIEDILAVVSGLSSRSGSLGRVLDDLTDANLLASSTLQLGNPKTSLKLLRLTATGAALFRSLFHQEPQESDWERLERLHEGERFPEHTLAVLIFALHARKRGWATEILPEVEGNARPDLVVARENRQYYVEVELSQKENLAKWRNLAALNSGKIALCAATPEGRQRLVGDCRLAKLSGVATDLQVLVQTSYKEINSSTPLWVEEW